MRLWPFIKQSIIKKLPLGFALSKHGGVIDVFYQSFAQAISDAEQTTVVLNNKLDPRNSEFLLSDFERLSGNDPCGHDLNKMTIEQRRQLIYQRLTALGG